MTRNPIELRMRRTERMHSLRMLCGKVISGKTKKKEKIMRKQLLSLQSIRV